jgi:hypothetical protein
LTVIFVLLKNAYYRRDTFELLITLDKEERILAKSFLDDYAYGDEGINHLIRVDDGIYLFEQDLMDDDDKYVLNN